MEFSCSKDVMKLVDRSLSSVASTSILEAPSCQSWGDIIRDWGDDGLDRLTSSPRPLLESTERLDFTEGNGLCLAEVGEPATTVVAFDFFRSGAKGAVLAVP